MKKCKKCGESPMMVKLGREKYVKCSTTSCWFGPRCKSGEEAEEEWDKIMGDGEESKELPVEEKRVPIFCEQIKNGNEMFIVCSDGACLMKRLDGVLASKWYECPPVPGTKADR